MRLDPSDGSFWSMPYPNDLLLDASTRTIDLSRFPNPQSNSLVRQITQLASEERDGFALNPVVSFAFDGAISTEKVVTNPEKVPSVPFTAFFLNITPSSPGYRESVPALSRFYASDGNYVSANTLTMIPWPGATLWPDATYAAIVLRTVTDTDGVPLAQSDVLGNALRGLTPQIADGEKLQRLYKPLADYLNSSSQLSADAIAAATVFTTDHPAADLRRMATSVTGRHATRWATPPILAHEEPDFCYLEGTVEWPQFQTGEPPFRSEGGRFEFDSAGLPRLQRTEIVKIVFTIPKRAMPAAGFPYMEYIHGSGGIASQMVDRGPVLTPGGPETPWQGPAYVAAKRGFAAGASAMPISPDRVPTATDYDYLQIGNLVALRDNFRQGVIELFLKRKFVETVRLDASTCPGASSSDGAFRFDMSRHVTMGQSMGAMYANLFGATSGETQAILPTGSGGYWSYFIFSTDLIPGAAQTLSLAVGVKPGETLDVLHPVMGLFQQFIEKTDPIAFIPHLVRRPLPDVPAKHALVPHGYDDLYFSRATQRAMAVGYGFPRVGDVIDNLMEAGLALFYRFPESDFPVRSNVAAGDGSMVTAVQDQWLEDPIQQNGHTVYVQIPAVQYQWGCFLETFARDGIPTVVTPKDTRFASCE
ncbi:MAG: hypothetical protein HYT87_09000 [Nitrospirae bacterium]|nr:hypothetical protein [Nitrospirota bacterium]